SGISGALPVRTTVPLTVPLSPDGAAAGAAAAPDGATAAPDGAAAAPVGAAAGAAAGGVSVFLSSQAAPAMAATKASAKIGRRGALGAEDHPRRPADLPPRRIIGDDAGDRQLEAHAGLEVEAVEAERSVAREDQHLLAGVHLLGGDGEGRAHAETAERAGI